MDEGKNAYDDVRPKILVTGAYGQLGNELRLLAHHHPGFQFLFTGSADLAIENKQVVEQFFERRRFHYCINCAAYTAVDKAESEKEKAFLINGVAVGHLADVCLKYQCRLIHISTDYVFDGKGHTPWKEDDPVAPVNVYGQSKLQGEKLALQMNRDVLIIRTSWVYSSFGNNFVLTMLRLFREKSALNIVSDQLGSPTYAADLAHVILNFVEKIHSGENFNGIFHFSNYGITSWFQFATYLRELANATCHLNPVTTDEYSTAAIRPQYSVLDTTRIKAALEIEIPFWKDSVKECVRLIKG